MKFDLSHLLKPLAEWIYAIFGDGWVRDATFTVFAPFFKYWYEYADYLLFWMLLPVFYLLPRRFRATWLLAASIGFLVMLHGSAFALAFTGYPLLVYWATGRPGAEGSARRRTAFWVTLTCLLFGAFLLWESFPEWHAAFPMGDRVSIPMLHLSGIAFVLPKLIHFIVERLKGRIGETHVRDYLLYLLFFPCFRIGPIERFPRFRRDLQRLRRRGVERFDVFYGVYRISLGLFKTLFWAALLIEWRQNAHFYFHEYDYWQVILTYPLGLLEVWLHFSAYCDIAIGTGRMMGFALPENFYFPWFSVNLAELWRRWHVSLSFWLRDYVFLPLGGNRRRSDFNYLVTFALCGVWHSISWNWLLWGAIQGVSLSFLRRWKILWYLVAHRPVGALIYLQSLQRFSARHARAMHWLAVAFTVYFFAYTGVYTLHDIPTATGILARLLGWGG